eukprot:2111296-Alexandrium_andersonii.AAC.1
MSRGSTARSSDNPLGDPAFPSVAENNRLVMRVLLLLQLCVAWNIYWILEQPVSSIMPLHPSFEKKKGCLGFKETFCWMK